MGAACILGCAGPDVTAPEAAFFADAQPWGFILFARNVDTPDRLRALTHDLRGAVGRDAPVFVDQEGGRVQRLRPPHWRDWPPPLDHMAASTDPARTAWLRARLIAHELRASGIEGNCIPGLDIAGDATHAFLRNRCLGTDAGTVAALGRAVAQGCLDGGVLPVIKHLPGHGRGAADSHHDLPVVTASRAELDRDFAPFRALADLRIELAADYLVMAAWLAPATHSAAVIDLIRRDIGFDGLLMTDDLSMQALGGDVTDRAARAIAAGCDVALHCNGDLAEMTCVVAASGAMTPTAQARADRALTFRRVPDDVDIAALEGQLAALTRAGGL